MLHKVDGMNKPIVLLSYYLLLISYSLFL